MVVNFTPPALAAQVFAEGDGLFRVKGLGPLRFGPCPKQLPHLKWRAFAADHYRRPVGIKPRDPAVNGILDALVKERLQFLLHLGLHPVQRPSALFRFGKLISGHLFPNNKKCPAPHCHKGRRTQDIKRPRKSKAGCKNPTCSGL